MYRKKSISNIDNRKRTTITYDAVEVQCSKYVADYREYRNKEQTKFMLI